MKVLVIEDSEKLRSAIQFRLRKAGYAVDVSADGAEGSWYASSNDYDAIILDRMLPGLDGLSILQRLRESGRETPLLILSVKSEVPDRVEGLRAGADDYLAKPFSFDELLARVEALVRRRYGQRMPVLQVGDLELDIAARIVRLAGREIDVGPREFRIIELLARHHGRVVSRAEIEQHIYGCEKDIFSNSIESAVSTIRKKLDAGRQSSFIRTRRGIGYVMEANNG